MNIPAVIVSAIARGAAVAMSVSGGKDSQAMEIVLADLHEKQNWPGLFFAIHANIGPEFDWAWTVALCERNAKALGHPLYVVRRENGETLLQTIQKRVATTGCDKPGFPSAACRYCTRAAKTDPIDKFLRRTSDLVINVMGLRADESRMRAKRPEVSVREGITAERLKKLSPEDALKAWRPDKERLALDWNPILEWTYPQVLEACGSSYSEMEARRNLFALGCYDMAFAGWPASPTYILGLDRHSCAICCMSAKLEIPVAGRFRPDLVKAIAEMEQVSGFSWQKGNPISALLSAETMPIPAQVAQIQPLPQRYRGGNYAATSAAIVRNAASAAIFASYNNRPTGIPLPGA